MEDLGGAWRGLLGSDELEALHGGVSREWAETELRTARRERLDNAWGEIWQWKNEKKMSHRVT